MVRFKHKTPAEPMTVVIWCDAGVRFFVAEGDLSHLHQKFMDGDCTMKESEDIFNLMYEVVNKTRRKKTITSPVFPLWAVREGAKVIVTGNLL